MTKKPTRKAHTTKHDDLSKHTKETHEKVAELLTEAIKVLAEERGDFVRASLEIAVVANRIHKAVEKFGSFKLVDPKAR